MWPSLLTRAPSTWACALMRQARPIITVNVHSPGEARMGGPGAREEFMREVTRCEDIAMSQFNRSLKNEVARKVVPGGSRGKQRFSFHQKPSLRRTAKGTGLRDQTHGLTSRSTHHLADRQRTFAPALPAEEGQAWKRHKKQVAGFLNWIQYRRRRNGPPSALRNLPESSNGKPPHRDPGAAATSHLPLRGCGARERATPYATRGVGPWLWEVRVLFSSQKPLVRSVCVTLTLIESFDNLNPSTCLVAQGDDRYGFTCLSRRARARAAAARAR
eukprot:4203070-Prymnesium_polylepis.1